MPITMEETRKICEKIRQGTWTWVVLYVVSATTGKSELLDDDPAFGKNEESKERGWLLTSEDLAPIGRGEPDDAPIIQALANRVDDWRPQGEVATIRVRFYSEDWKKQTEVSVSVCGLARQAERPDIVQTKLIISQSQAMGEVSLKALEQAGKDQREVHQGYRHQLGQQAATISQQQSIITFQQAQIVAMGTENAEQRKEIRELQKTIRELEAGGGWQSIALKALDPANVATQGSMVAILSSIFAAMGAKSIPEAIVMAGKMGGESLAQTLAQMLAPASAPEIAQQHNQVDAQQQQPEQTP